MDGILILNMSSCLIEVAYGLNEPQATGTLRKQHMASDGKSAAEDYSVRVE